MTPSTDTAERLAPEQAGRLMRWATYASVSVALTLIAAKLAAWFMTDSVSVLSSLLDSFLDAMASIINLFAVRHALQPADQEHRFGHGKAEPLAAMAQAAFIAGSAAFLLIEGARNLIDPEPVTHQDVGIAVMILSIVMTLGLVTFQRYVVRKTRSTAIGADHLHYQSDLLMNSGVILALVLSGWLGWALVDPVFGIAIAFYILWSSWQIARRAYDMLMDRELDEADRQRIADIAANHPRVRAFHDLRTRASGPNTFIQLHLEMDDRLPLIEAHTIADEVEAEILAAFPEAEVLIHQDPVSIKETHEIPGET